MVGIASSNLGTASEAEQVALRRLPSTPRRARALISTLATPVASRSRNEIMPLVNDSPVVYIIDDDASMRAALEGLLRSVDIPSRSYPSVAAFLESNRNDSPGCLVLDVRLPGTNGLDFQAQLKGYGIRLPVILVSGHGDIAMSVRGMKAGAIDFLTKPYREQDILDAINVAIRSDEARRAADAKCAAVRARYATLSARERQVIHLVIAGNMNKQAAATLGLSEITVKIHRSSAMRKMGTRTLVEMALMLEALGATD
jgi:FixJ family two-component response regulator